MDESVRYVTNDHEKGNLLKSLTFAVAMSLHSILEGWYGMFNYLPSNLLT
jgi:hypothetical protein